MLKTQNILISFCQLSLLVSTLVRGDEPKSSGTSSPHPEPFLSSDNFDGNHSSHKSPASAELSPASPESYHFSTATFAPAQNFTGTYLIVAPNVVRPGLPYAASVNVLKTNEPSLIVRMEIRDSKNSTISARVIKGVRPGIPQTATIDKVPEDSLLAGEDYFVYIKGETISSKTVFENQQPIKYNPKSVSIFVQTDKAIYKPGSVVRYRVIVVNPDLTPYSEAINLHIDDPGQNRINNLLKVPLNKGVFSGEFELSNDPPLGSWAIHVETVGVVKFEKEFSVDKYVLPKFEVNVKTQPFVTINDDLTVFVDAKYTYGKGVQGNAKILLELPFPRWVHRGFIPAPQIVGDSIAKEPEGVIERTVKLNGIGEATVTFTNEELKKRKLILDYGGSTIRVTASVTELLTDNERNSSADIMVYSQDVKLELMKQGETFKPGLGYNVVVALKQMDDTPVKLSLPRRVQVSIFYGYGDNHEEGKEVKVQELDAHGMTLLQLRPPANCTGARVEANYDREGKDNFANSQIYGSLYLEAGKSPSRSYIQVTSDNQGIVDTGKTLSFTVSSTEPLNVLTYQVIARGIVVMSQEMLMNSDHATITFTGTAQMAPKARLVVYAIRPSNNEILVDSIDFKLEGLFRNNVSLSIDKTLAEPGDPIKFMVKAAPDSYIGLLAVDQSVVLLKSGNDITKDLIEQDIEEYDTTVDSTRRRFWEFRRKRSTWYPWWGIGGKDASSIFKNSGLVVLTDAYLYKEPEPLSYYRRRYFLSGIYIIPTSAQVTSPSVQPRGIKQQRIRNKFPETWLFKDFIDAEEQSDTGEIVYETKAPDTITSWISSAFAINDQVGIGIASNIPKMKVFRPFFIRLELPYSVKRGEKFALQVIVFNYMESEQDVTVTLKHQPNSGFEFVQKDDSILKKNKQEKGFNVRYVSVPGGGVSKAVYFPIILTEIGQVKLSVLAQAGANAGDAVEQFLLVEPEGYRVDRNVPLIVDPSKETINKSTRSSSQAPALPDNSVLVHSPPASDISIVSGGVPVQFKKTIDFQWPADYVQGSRKARFDIIGDIMGPVLSNVENLVRMPFGCGEQNMVTLVPNIVIMRYLRGTHRSDPALESKATKYMETGYQRQLTYRRTDNSFSAFGESDSHGSTWLTAFVVRSFKQAQSYIFIDDQLLEKSIAFLISQQQADTGAFAERGEIHHKQMQGGASDGGIALTAYVLIALLENHVQNDRARSYLENHLGEVKDDPYALAVVTYALHLSNSPKRNDALKMLESLKIVGTDGTVHWTSKSRSKDHNSKAKDVVMGHYLHQAQPADIELSSYALLTYMLLEDKDRGIPIVRWLTSERNSLGGFLSTQDTVMALQALGAYAEKTYAPMFNLAAKIKNGADSHQFSVNPQNALVLQSYEVTNFDEHVEMEASGTSVAFVQVQYSYHRQALLDNVPFYCSKDVREIHGGNRLQLDLCCNYTLSGRSNMALAEVNSLSGYKFDSEEMQKLTKINDLQRVDLDNDDTKMNIYFNPLGENPVCLSLYSDMVYQISDQKPAQFHLYDYYTPEQQLKSSYALRESRSLSENCPECWPEPNSHKSISRPTNGAAICSSAYDTRRLISSLTLIFLTAVFQITFSA